ncbi:RNA-guided endonuclease InsQ/TnpB family protein [Kribbella jiaozuonensis]|uniref:Transposase n=1 Tax=Kribbella jiaozuonensis TaxID=2575441 RepID=A0A4U3LNV0_9ACTN|nr:RNA-guided endonuclease TnpB family protein [Kribbella jiaozuonensis]TKK76007.1 transposase [Kribbella jiaozuonensis]
MSRFRLDPTPAQVTGLLGHCAHARYVWNLATEQWSMRKPGQRGIPGYAEQARQLTAARAAFGWLRAGSQIVQQQALRDFEQARRNYIAGTHGRPTWRRMGQHEGFRVAGPQAQRVERINRKWARVLVPKLGWVRFRVSRSVPAAKSYRITCDRVGRWHIAFAVVPASIPAPGTGKVVGIDRGISVSVALSTGELLHCPGIRDSEHDRLVILQRRLARARRGSKRRQRVKSAIAKMYARSVDRRRDWIEKVSTDIARRFDLIRVENLRIPQMARRPRPIPDPALPGGYLPNRRRNKAALNRAILASGWGLLVRRLEDKAPTRVERVHPAYTSQTCSRCGHRAPENRESQAFRCRCCGHRNHADVNAAINIAAGRAVRARRDRSTRMSVKREPQLTTSV